MSQDPTKKVKVKPKDKPHYVNNAQFSAAVVDYVAAVNEQLDQGKPAPQVPNYVAECFIKISEGLSHKSNFVRYPYRDDMVGDGVENCLKAIRNYNIEAATRTGRPNAFAYFTQIVWFAFLRRIKKEKTQLEIKMKGIADLDFTQIIDDGGILANGQVDTSSFIDSLKERIDDSRSVPIKIETTKRPAARKRRRIADSDLSGFIG
jgi:hypothetical protein